MLTITMMRSAIGSTPKQRKTLQALGLHKIRQERSFEDTPAVRGMVERVKHLVEVKTT